MAKKLKRFEMKSGAPTGVGQLNETIEVKFEMKSLIDAGQDFFIVEGYASAFGLIDTYDDRIAPGAYVDTIKNHPAGFPAFVMHNSFSIPVGMFFQLNEDNKGLFVKSRLPKADDLVKGRLVPQIKTGSINALSIGFRPLEFHFEMEDGVEIRVLTKIELREISFITSGMQADSGALLTDIKKQKNCTEKQNMTNAVVDVYRKGAPHKIKTKITEFYHEEGKSDPFSEDSVISTDELKNLSKSNMAYAIRELKLSSNASNYLAGLVLAPESVKTDDPKSEKTEKSEPDSSSPSSEEEKNADLEKKKSEEAVSNGLDDLIKTLKTKKETSNV